MERLSPPWSGAREGLRGRGFAGQGWQAYVWKVKEVRAGQVCPARMFEIVKREHDRLGGFLVLQHQRGVSREGPFEPVMLAREVFGEIRRQVFLIVCSGPFGRGGHGS